MIISVDHGNKSIKTPNALFTSGLIVSEGLQGFKTDYICWNNKYYTLTEQRIAYLRDKTEDERFYVLTLFAIAKELERRKVPETLNPIDITLLVGLPPAHYEQLHSRFEQYFLRRREIVDFEYNGKYYSIRVSKVLSYPQAFAAAVTQFGTLKAHSVAYIIDIGGFTIDVLKLRSGHPDLAVVESFEKGVITLYNGIASKCNALYARILEDCDIDEVIRNQPTVLPGEVQQLIRTMTSDFLTEFYNFLRERGVDVSTSKCVFAGGGSLLLRGMIERGNKVAFPIFIEDIHAMLAAMSSSTRVRWRQMGSNKKARVVLQFNEMDFRHRRALEILRQRPRSMSELVVSAILHYTSCPEVADEHSKEWIASTVKKIITEMISSGELQISAQTPAPETNGSSLAADDLAELGGVMGMFRTKG